MAKNIDPRTLTLRSGTAVTAEERAALGLPAEAPEVPTLHGEPTVGTYDRYGLPAGHPERTGYYAYGAAHLDLPDGTVRFEHGSRRNSRTIHTSEASAVAAWEQAVWANAVASDTHREREERWGPTITAMAASNARKPLGGWSLNLDRKAVVGETVLVWGFGGYRYAIVVETSKGRGIVAAYATPASPRDHRYTKTTKYAQHPGQVLLNQGS
jgi:hypothetical protein